MTQNHYSSCLHVYLSIWKTLKRPYLLTCILTHLIRSLKKNTILLYPNIFIKVIAWSSVMFFETNDKFSTVLFFLLEGWQLAVFVLSTLIRPVLHATLNSTFPYQTTDSDRFPLSASLSLLCDKTSAGPSAFGNLIRSTVVHNYLKLFLSLSFFCLTSSV